MTASTYTRYTIQAYQDASPDFAVIKDFVLVEVFAENEKEAIQKAQKLIVKNSYRVSAVAEYYYDSRIEGKSGKDE